jgi:predicted nucleic acid-binding protein
MTQLRSVSGALLLLDADILYPIRVCDFVLTAASLRLIARPVVSGEILDEAFRNVLKDRPDLEPLRVARRFNHVRAAVDGHDQPIPRRQVDTSIVNPKDRHVLAAALHHRVDFIVTNDVRLRREISAWLVAHGDRIPHVAAIAADDLASRLVDEVPAQTESVVRQMASRFRDPPRTYADVLAALCRSLPSLARLDLIAPHE